MRISWWKLAPKIVVGLGVMPVALMGILIVRAWVVNPQGSRRWRLECSANLQTFFTAQRAHMREKGRYTTSVMEVGYSPERDNRYAYFLGPGPMQRRDARGVRDTEQAMGIEVDTGKYSAEEKAVMSAEYRQLPERVRRELGLLGQCPQCDITMACMGQLDEDPTLDVWTVSTRDRRAPDGEDIPPGQPYHEVDDGEQ